MRGWISALVLIVACTDGNRVRPVPTAVEICERTVECLVQTCPDELGERLARSGWLTAVLEERSACASNCAGTVPLEDFRACTRRCDAPRSSHSADFKRTHRPLRECESACVEPYDPEQILHDSELDCDSTAAHRDGKPPDACPYVRALRIFEKLAWPNLPTEDCAGKPSPP